MLIATPTRRGYIPPPRSGRPERLPAVHGVCSGRILRIDGGTRDRIGSVAVSGLDRKLTWGCRPMKGYEDNAAATWQRPGPWRAPPGKVLLSRCSASGSTSIAPRETPMWPPYLRHGLI